MIQKRTKLVFAALFLGIAASMFCISLIWTWERKSAFTPRIWTDQPTTSVPIYPLDPINESSEPISSLNAVYVEINGRAGLFLVDTGASDTVISSRFARTLQIPDQEIQTLAVEGNIQTGTVRAFKAKSFLVGDVLYSDFMVIVLELEHIQSWTHTDLDGILGGNVLNALPYRLDFPRNTLTISEQIRVPPEQAISIQLLSNHIHINCIANGYPVTFMLDTGASSTLLDENQVRYLFPELPPKVELVPGKVIDINQETLTERKKLILPNLRIGPITETEWPVTLQDINLLGQDFTGRFILVVDPERLKIGFLLPE
ncbi:MAG: retroviral-like aspartic protease family protein [Sedimentisphaerales bacterium]|nr:retroviral-like aspartic protease family protein [Sedimentisphaerales bacterium]